MRINLLIFICLLTLLSCNREYKGDIVKLEVNLELEPFNKWVFGEDIINSKQLLDTFKKLSDTFFVDTASYVRKPKATLFINNHAKTFYRVFENPKGVITAIGFYRNSKQVCVAEYYENGQIMCSFSVKSNGIRDGGYICYHENGIYRTIGYYKNDVELSDSTRHFDSSGVEVFYDN